MQSFLMKKMCLHQNMNSRNAESFPELFLGLEYGHFLMTSSEGYVACLNRHFFEFHIFEYNYFAEVILYQNMNSKNDEPLSELFWASKYGHFSMTSSEGYVAWLSRHFFEFHILEYGYCAEVILYQNVNSKNDEPLSDLLLGSKYSHFLMTSSEGK